ncbi:MAG: hypothetical protein KAR56_03030 [Thermoplasmata archaeon]|nr:hypothetical protein [Thermoplasmata archaeon]
MILLNTKIRITKIEDNTVIQITKDNRQFWTLQMGGVDGTREDYISAGFWENVESEPIPARLKIHFDVHERELYEN